MRHEQLATGKTLSNYGGQQAEPICAVRSSSLEEGINACSAEAYGLLETLRSIHAKIHNMGSEKDGQTNKAPSSLASRPFETEEVLRQCRDLALHIGNSLFS